MRPTWTNREQGARVSDLYGPHTPRESGSAGPWYVPRPVPRVLDKMGRPVPRALPSHQSASPSSDAE
jgi:hypothetical protein